MNTSLTRINNKRAQQRSKGFTLIEVMIAAVILTVGLLSLMALFAKALSAVRFSEEGQIARQKAREAMESVYTARNDDMVSFDQLQNDDGKGNGGLFPPGFQPMHLPGANGIPGTTQDTNILDRVVLPGKNGVIDTVPGAASPGGDDVFVPLSNFQRQILITDVKDPDGSTNLYMRKITVTVRINPGSMYTRDYETSGYISTSQQQ
jgi:prepilin-type N-terminal cleavage/methylation domain-containing protein